MRQAAGRCFLLQFPRDRAVVISMINRATGEVSFQSGLHICPHRPVHASFAQGQDASKIQSRKLPLKGWKRQVLGLHTSDHGTFEVEALTAEEDRVYLVLLSHSHNFYEKDTPGDAERRAFHEGVISSDLAGQTEFTWGEVHCRLESMLNQDWLVIAYGGGAQIPLPEKEVILNLFAHEKMPEGNT